MQIAGRVRSFRRPRLAAPAGGLRAAGRARPAAEEPAADDADGEARKRRGLRELDAAPTARAGGSGVEPRLKRKGGGARDRLGDAREKPVVLEAKREGERLGTMAQSITMMVSVVFTMLYWGDYCATIAASLSWGPPWRWPWPR